MTFYLEISRSEFEIAFSRKGWLIDMDKKGYKLSIYDHDIDFCVTMVEWVDVTDNDRGDIRRRRAIDISNYICVCGIIAQNFIVIWEKMWTTYFDQIEILSEFH